MPKDPRSEIAVITKAKDLSRYIIQTTEKSPKKFRFTFTNTLRNLSFEMIENLYLANDTFVRPDLISNRNKRLDYQMTARNKARLVCYLSELAYEEKAITAKQYEQISKKGEEVIRMISGWIVGDSKRFGSLNK